MYHLSVLRYDAVNHSYSPCLPPATNDTGDAHSPIYGWSGDGYPIFGPYQANATLAVSCWKVRDYASTSATGCSSGTRTCVFKDEYDYTQGKIYTVLVCCLHA